MYALLYSLSALLSERPRLGKYLGLPSPRRWPSFGT
jgi:hypothetical protein